MRVLAFPAFKNKDLNPYQFLLYSEVEAFGVIVDEFSIKNVFRHRYDIIHLHWPESNKLRKNLLIGIIYSCLILCLLKISKLKGSRIIWTVHNEIPHDVRHPKLTKWFYSGVLKMLDGFIFLNDASLHKLYSILDPLSRKSKSVIPHGHYRDFYINTLSEKQAKEKLNIDPTKKMVLYFGQVRPYKGIDSLIRAFKHSMLDDTILYICGAPSQEHVKFTNELLQSSCSNIVLDLKFIPNDQIEIYFNAADLVVLPYKQILNSGTILLSLSFNKPVLVPGFESINELKKQFGDKWIFTFEPDRLDATVLEKTVRNVQLNNETKLDLNSINWDLLAARTVEFYKKCIEENN